MARTCLSTSNFHRIFSPSNCSAICSTPAELGGSIPNADRGIFHIEGSYWSFINIELINGPYGIFARDASNNRYERLRAHDNYESGSSNGHVRRWLSVA